jgi:L-iditol 2-dehydrogenase
MKVAKLYSFDDIRVEDSPVPEIGENDALVRVKACGICSGDIMPWYIEKKAPLVLGHEPAGDIVRVGSRVKNFRAGERVFFHHHAPCFSCKYCNTGDYVQCDTWKTSRIIPGGISEYVQIPQVNLQGDTLKLPDEISYEHATLIEPTACVVKGLKRALIKEGDTVLVMGLGVMGQTHIILAKKCGAGLIIGADSVNYRIERAIENGADTVIDITRTDLTEAVRKTTRGDMSDITVVGPGDTRAMSEGINCTGRGGRVVIFTPVQPGDFLKLYPNEIYFKDINIITSYSCGPDDTKDALNLIADGTVKAKQLITHRFPFVRTSEAYSLTAKAQNSLKVIVYFP